MKNTLFILFFAFLLLPGKAYGFVPPEFYVQGISNLWAIIGGGVAVVSIPLIISYRYAKNIISKNRKAIFFLLFYTLFITIFLSIFFYYKFYKPLYNDSYLFPTNQSRESVWKIDSDLDPTLFNHNYVLLNGVLRDPDLSPEDKRYGLTVQEIEEKIKKKTKVYFIDLREKEEFAVGKIKDAKNIRFADIGFDTEIIKKTIRIDEENFSKSLFILYCHTGDRGHIGALRINNQNVKYLIGGLENLEKSKIQRIGVTFSDKALFKKDYQKKFQTNTLKATEMIKNNALVLDLRSVDKYKEKHIKDSIFLKLNIMPTAKYEEELTKVLKKSNKDILIIAEKYSDLFYANLIIKRLIEEHNFKQSQFRILFAQFDTLTKDKEIKTLLVNNNYFSG